MISMGTTSTTRWFYNRLERFSERSVLLLFPGYCPQRTIPRFTIILCFFLSSLFFSDGVFALVARKIPRVT